MLARISQEELEQLLRGYGYMPYFVDGDDPYARHLDPEPMHQNGGHARTLPGPDSQDSSRCPAGGRHRAPALADDRAALAQGLDRAQHGRRQTGRGDVPGSSGADGRHGQARAHSNSRRLDEELQTGRVVRCDRQVQGPVRGFGPPGRASDERQPARQRRRVDARFADARLCRLCRGGAQSRGGRCRGHAGAGNLLARRDEVERPGPQLPRLQPRRDGLEPLELGVRGDRSLLRGDHSGYRRPRRAATAG